MNQITRWYHDQNTLVDLGSWLNSTGFFEDTSHVINFFEKPWHYEDQLKVMHEFRKGNNCPDCGNYDECGCHIGYNNLDEYIEKFGGTYLNRKQCPNCGLKECKGCTKRTDLLLD